MRVGAGALVARVGLAVPVENFFFLGFQLPAVQDQGPTMMIGQEITTQAFGSLPQRQSAGRGLEQAANASGTTLQSNGYREESACRSSLARCGRPPALASFVNQSRCSSHESMRLCGSQTTGCAGGFFDPAHFSKRDHLTCRARKQGRADFVQIRVDTSKPTRLMAPSKRGGSRRRSTRWFPLSKQSQVDPGLR